jgi:hypothetical protein
MPDFLLGEGGEKMTRLRAGLPIQAVTVFVRTADRPHLERAGIETLLVVAKTAVQAAGVGNVGIRALLRAGKSDRP